MNNFLDKMERKLGRFAIKNLMLYIIGIYIIGALLSVASPTFYYLYLALNIEKVMQGEVWRLVTFILEPMSSVNGGYERRNFGNFFLHNALFLLDTGYKSGICLGYV